MSNRIKKVLGYGLRMSHEEASSLLDLEKGWSHATLEGYREFVETKHGAESHQATLARMPLPDEQNIKLGYECISIDDDEYEESGYVSVVITPVSMLSEWKRSDNAIDYYEDIHDKRDSQGMTATMKFLNQHLFPFEGDFRNIRTGMTVPRDAYYTLKSFIQMLKSDAKDKSLIKAVQKLCVEAGLKDDGEFELLQPIPPTEVQDIAEYVGIFRNPETVRELQPAILIYWA